MKCPYCGFLDSKVIDSRPTDGNECIRRRRVCIKCEKRFTTYERVEDQTIVVIKKDDTREPFSRTKLLNSLIKSCEKRPIKVEVLEDAVDEIEKEINYLNQKEVTSAYIGDLVMDKLKTIDKVAYVRFASVYREFADVQSFADEIENLRE
ncbi:transcriptional regulator NrdR [Helcococcus ovis]|uniref:Transcriptional repressor NrdR n=1 Tax=Helcococcus ovis TaxID=72026 RepID=A0A4R9C386_9FIRM|nr:transcriptional regulator NrdR [Helcococcus ovis]TFF64173.1 transcriptional repressor NrdR [Helcococcus ovis]TFF66449.1 transcriptional repressor NrdR [Helcococcus ovis]TFF66941.1 transcriptional repressor NrdR [Helcococcus ovis]WNZ01855.1 transcriptional regulator NrdR [Helcococcus ovis]